MLCENIAHGINLRKSPCLQVSLAGLVGEGRAKHWLLKLGIMGRLHEGKH